MLAAWLKDNKDELWSNSLQDIQIRKNRAYHSGIQQSPYKTMFGIDFRLGLTSTNLPDEILDKIGNEIEDEEHLNEYLNTESLEDAIFNHKVFLLIFI